MIIDAISDLHGYLPKTKGGDLLIIAGDLTARDTGAQYLLWRDWLREQDYAKKVFICGNHDRGIQDGRFYFTGDWLGAEWLNDSGTEFEGLKIWGSPWTKTFEGINPHCTAFTVDTEVELDQKWALIPDDIDILVTHSPPHGVCDLIRNRHGVGDIPEHSGSEGLYSVVRRIQPKFHFFGHIHEGRGKGEIDSTKCFNCSHVDEKYNPRHPPVRVRFEKPLSHM